MSLLAINLVTLALLVAGIVSLVLVVREDNLERKKMRKIIKIINQRKELGH